MRMSFTNILVLKVRTSLTLEKHPDNFSDKLKTTKDLTKTAQYFNTSTIANSAKTQIHDNFKVLKWCQLWNLYCLESMVIEEENLILNTQLTLNGKRPVLSKYWYIFFNCFCYNFVVNFVRLTHLLSTITNISNLLLFTS